MLYKTKLWEDRRMATELEMIPPQVYFSGLNVSCSWVYAFLLQQKQKTKNKKPTQFLCCKAIGLPKRRISLWRLWALAAVGSVVFELAIKPCVRTSGRRSLGPPHTAGHHRC